MKKTVTLLLLAIAAFCSAAEPVEHRAVSESYLDPEIKVAFPANAGIFRKNEVSRSFNPMIGTKIRYSDKDGYCADVYIYSLPDTEKGIPPAVLKAHYDEIKAAVLNLSSKGLSLKNVSMTNEKTESLNGLQVYSAEFRLTWTGGKIQNSFLKLFVYQGKIIKIRMSCAKSNAETFASEILALFPIKVVL